MSTTTDPKAFDPIDPPIDINIPDNYVQHTLKSTKPLPPVTLSNFWTELNWLNVAILGITPTIALYGLFTTKLTWQTALFSVLYYYITGLGMSPSFVVIGKSVDGVDRYYRRISSTLGP